MGRSTTTKYALKIEGSTLQSWHVGKQVGGYKGYGKPTAANLAKHVSAFIDSLKPGGANHHLSLALGHMPIPNWAKIVRNDGSGAVVAEWKAPAFMAI